MTLSTTLKLQARGRRLTVLAPFTLIARILRRRPSEADGEDQFGSIIDQSPSAGRTPSIIGHRSSFPAGLTARQAEVLRLLAEGLTNQEIADELIVSRRTVDHHVAAIYQKTGARRRADAACYALRHSLTREVSAA